MQAEIITIGDEILIGQVVDTNSAWMGVELNKIGVQVHRITTISDAREAIVGAIDAAWAEADLILMTGGLGPTQDDITKQTLAEYFDSELVMNESILKDVKRLFKAYNVKMADSNIGQAMVPEVCTPLRNPNGTAPGMWFERNGKVLVSMPGVPYEMKAIMQDHVLGMVKATFRTPEIVHRTVLTQGIGESSLAEMIAEWEDELRSSGLKLAYLPSPGIVRLRISAVGDDRAAIENSIETRIDALNALIPQYVFGAETDKLEGLLGDLLRQANATVSTAESCTGGYIAHLLTSIAGSSEYFLGSVVSYANSAKQELLGVSSEVLTQQGAVSEPVVLQMAQGARKALGATYAVSTSGIAGPGGGSESKPVGTVWIAVAGPNGAEAKRFQFGTNRERNIHKSALAAMNMLRKLILADLDELV